MQSAERSGGKSKQQDSGPDLLEQLRNDVNHADFSNQAPTENGLPRASLQEDHANSLGSDPADLA